MNRRVSTAEVQQNFPSILHDVEEGETIVITSDGEEIALLSPVETASVGPKRRDKAHHELIEHLRRVQAIDIGPWTRAEIYEDQE